MNHLQYLDVLLENEDIYATVRDIPYGTPTKYFDTEHNETLPYSFGMGHKKLIGKRIKVQKVIKYPPLWRNNYDGWIVYFHQDWLSFYEGEPISLFPKD